MQGKGIVYFNNGDRYEGEFVDQVFEGYGEYYYHVNGQKFEGIWAKDNKVRGI